MVGVQLRSTSKVELEDFSLVYKEVKFYDDALRLSGQWLSSTTTAAPTSIVAAVTMGTMGKATKGRGKLCIEFYQKSTCARGEACRYYHVEQQQVQYVINAPPFESKVNTSSKYRKAKRSVAFDSRLLCAIGTSAQQELHMFMCLDSMANVSCTSNRETMIGVHKRGTAIHADCANGTPLVFTEVGISRYWDKLVVQYSDNRELGNIISYHDLGMLTGIRVESYTEPGIGMTARVLDFNKSTVSIFTTHMNGLLSCLIADLCRPMSGAEAQSNKLRPLWALSPAEVSGHVAPVISVNSLSSPRSTVMKPTIIDPNFAKLLTVKETTRAFDAWYLVTHRGYINPEMLATELDERAIVNCRLTSKDVKNMLKLLGAPLPCRMGGFRNARAITNSAPKGSTEIGAYHGMDTFFVRTRAGKLVGWLLLTCRTSKKRIAGKLASNATKDVLKVIYAWIKWWNDRERRITDLECDSHKGFKALEPILRSVNIRMDFSTMERHSYLSESSVHGLRIRLRSIIASLEWELPDCLHDYAIQFALQQVNYDTQTPLNSSPNFMVERLRLNAASLRVGFGQTVIVAGTDERTPVVGVVIGVDHESNNGSIRVLVPSDDGSFDARRTLVRTHFEAVCITEGIRERMARMVARDSTAHGSISQTEVDVMDIIQAGEKYVPMDDSTLESEESQSEIAAPRGNSIGINQLTEGRQEMPVEQLALRATDVCQSSSSIVNGPSPITGVTQSATISTDKPYRPNRKGRKHHKKTVEIATDTPVRVLQKTSAQETAAAPAPLTPVVTTSSGRPTKRAARFVSFERQVSAVHTAQPHPQERPQFSPLVKGKSQPAYGHGKARRTKQSSTPLTSSGPGIRSARPQSCNSKSSGYATSARVQSLVGTITGGSKVDPGPVGVSKRHWVQKVVVDGLTGGRKCNMDNIETFCKVMGMPYDTLFDDDEDEIDSTLPIKVNIATETANGPQMLPHQMRVARIAQIDGAIANMEVEQASPRHIAALIKTRSILIQQETGIEVDISTIFDTLEEPAEGEAPARVPEEMKAHYVFRLTLSKALAKYPQETIVALGKEFGQLIDYHVFTGVKLAELSHEERRKIIDSLLFLTEKMDDKGLFECLKARLAARGDEQPCASHAPENSASTASLITIMVILTHAAKRGHVLEIADIKGAFLHPHLDKRIHMRLNKAVTAIFVEAHPEFKQFVNPDGTLIVQLNKAVYGLKEAAHLFQEHLSGVLIKLGWTRDETDPCLFTKWEDGKQCIVCTHVDDLLISHNSVELRDQLIHGLEDVYGPLKRQQGTDLRFLGMHVRQFPEKGIVEIDQRVFIEKLQERFGIEGKASTPTQDDIFKDKSHAKNEDGSARVKAPDHPDYMLTDAHLYLSMVMCLMFLAKRSRGDILLPVCFLATRCQAPTMEDHYKVVRVFQYLNATIDMVLRIQPDSLLVEAFADASHNCHVQAQSHTGIVVYVGNVPVFMKSIKQKQQPAKSSTVAELYALHDAMAPVHRVQDILRTLRVPQPNTPPIVWQDNTSTLRIVDIGHGAYDTTGCVNLRYFAIKHYVDQRSIQLKYKPTADMKADGLTKHFGGQIFQRNRAWLGVRNPL
jgi:hypothetical protein